MWILAPYRQAPTPRPSPKRERLRESRRHAREIVRRWCTSHVFAVPATTEKLFGQDVNRFSIGHVSIPFCSHAVGGWSLLAPRTKRFDRGAIGDIPSQCTSPTRKFRNCGSQARRASTTLAGGVNRRWRIVRRPKAQRADTDTMCRPSGPESFVFLPSGGSRHRLGLCRTSGT